MKIGVVIGYMNDAGGVRHVTEHMINALKKQHDVVLYTATKYKTKLVDNIPLVPIQFRRGVVVQRSMGETIAKSAKDCDILVYTDGTAGIPDTTQPIIYYAHSWEPLKTPDYFSIREYVRLDYRKYEQAMHRMRRKIIHNENNNINIVTNSKYIATRIHDDTNREAEVIYPPVNIDRFNAIIEDEWKPQGSVVTVSSFQPLKKYTFTCDVMRDVKGRKTYKILGNVNTPIEKKYYAQLCKKYPEVTMIPNAHIDDVNEELRRSHVYFHAKIEDFGISIIEAIAAGCVPIVPDAGGFQETVPIPELRYEYNNKIQAQEKIEDALSGMYDKHRDALQDHIMQYDTSVFNKKILDLVDSIK